MQKKKKKPIKKWIEYGLIVAFIALLFTTDLKAEVFGFVQRGFIKLGLFQPDIEQVDTTTTGKTAYTAHPFKLKNQDGEILNLANLEGKVVFINFWATWCPPCIAEMPSINKLYQDYKTDKEVVFLMISLDRDFTKAKKFNQDKGFDFDIYRPMSAMPSEFRARGIPRTFVLSKNGEIVFSHLGLGNYNTDEFKNFIDNLKTK